MMLEQADYLERLPDAVCINCGWRRLQFKPIDVEAEVRDHPKARRRGAFHGAGGPGYTRL